MKQVGWILIFLSFLGSAQTFSQKTDFTRQDTLRGSNTAYRNWWDVQHYAVHVQPNYDKKSIQGTVEIRAKRTKSKPNLLQLDLQEPMQIDAAFIQNGQNKNRTRVEKIKREGNVYFLDLNQYLKNPKDSTFTLSVNYSGKPREAKKAPWDGGWVFAKDEEGRPWMSVACQGLGASVWFPNKDYLGDEPDEGADIFMTIPTTWNAIANGRKVGETMDEKSQLKTEHWRVTSPINNYNIIPYIGHYTKFQDSYTGEKGVLDLDYYVLDYNLEKAKTHFDADVKPMLKCFEEWMGPYPFYEDSFKLVEAPYLGMEHQSNIAYGNKYQKGYLGGDISGTGYGNSWDYIIVHEAGHEWYGNNITAADIADMWIQEGFTTYTETLFVECQQGKQAANAYVQGERNMIRPNGPMIGPYGVNREGANLYGKGANVVHTIRQLMDDDEKFKTMLREMNRKFYHATVTTKQIEDFISDFSGKDLGVFFDQYLRTEQIPILEIRRSADGQEYRYVNVLQGFDMPLKLADRETWIYPTTHWKAYLQNDQDIIVDANFLVISRTVSK